MRIVPHIAFGLVILACHGCSDSTTTSSMASQCPAGQHPLSSGCAWDPLVIVVGPVGDAGCPGFSPNPAFAHENQLVEWTNDTSATLTIEQVEDASTGIPLAAIDPGQTSAGEFWSTPGDLTVAIDGCGSSSGTIVIAGGASAGGGGSGCQRGSYCYQWDCHGDSECLATNPTGAATGASDEGNDPSCSGLLMFGQQFWNIPPATQSCTLTP